ncbi:MAG: serine--tRNA ligase [Chitinivibrionales bacterium]|nr:serine--tRNA ligase [Chitinivibrionales bacterium]
MLDIQFIRDNPEKVKQASANKKDPADIDALLELDGKRRNIIYEVEQLKSLRNKKSQEIGTLKKEKKDVSVILAEMKSVSDTIKRFDSELKTVEEDIRAHAIKIPNISHGSVPHGVSEEDNVVVYEWGDRPGFDFEPRDHMQLGESLGIFDFTRGAKISGAGFPLYKGYGALLERALLTFFLDTHTTKNGYTEIFPPFLANEQSHFGTGQLPKSGDQMYYINEDSMYCIPTAEVPVTNIHQDEILAHEQLPVQYCAYSACFRREAGSYGKDTKGFLRVHQFNKVEMVKFAIPETSYDELESLRGNAEGILQALKLPYRVLELCDADLSFAAAKCYDLEVWAPGEKKYLEVSSCSNFESFQARRMNIRYKPADGGKPRFVHTLNGSGVATARILVALLETYQTAGGTVRIPEVLQPYMHGMTEIRP